jgi:uncharacterized glyoxalase superfamily protein PhnB
MTGQPKHTRSTVMPALHYRDAHKAIDFLCKAFGFEKKAAYEDDHGVVMHAELTFGNGMIMLGQTKPDTDYGILVVLPGMAGGVTLTTYIVVDFGFAILARAKAAGAAIVREPVSQDYGGRDYTCKDPEGNVWTFGTYDPWAVQHGNAEKTQMA